ncbi:MAG: beta-hydroxyacyl-ACP dehydratase [Desulfobacteraceae bacterium]|nr:beta-hydroxyacyl-ACP dehydratase [Desulfobacteraceae bacterium]
MMTIKTFHPDIIRQILPHRKPFCFVDEIISYDEQKDITASVYLAADMVFFAGHFPGNPIMPGVLVTEALAQTAGLLAGLQQSGEYENNRSFYFLASTDIKYLHPATPGQTLILQATLEKSFGGLFRFKVKARVEDKLIASGNLSLARQPD